MSKRERVIIILMVCAVLFGGYNLLYKPSAKPGATSPGKGSEDLNQFVIDVAKKITDRNITAYNTHIVAKATEKWTTNPFEGYELFAGKGVATPAKAAAVTGTRGDRSEPQKRKVEFQYTGYLNIGERRFAVINGIEYTAGENLALPGFFLKSIHDSWVEIGVEGNTETIILPLGETAGTAIDEKRAGSIQSEQQTTYPLEEPASQKLDERNNKKADYERKTT